MAIAALSDSVASRIGMVTRPVANRSACAPAPCASLPTRIAAGRCQSTAVWPTPSRAAASQTSNPSVRRWMTSQVSAHTGRRRMAPMLPRTTLGL